MRAKPTRVAPFHGYWYDPERVATRDVVTLSYDGIDAARRRAHMSRSVYNVTHLLLPEVEGGGYTGAANRFAIWCAAGMVVRDPRPALYVLEQRFADADDRALVVRRGLYAVIGVEGYDRGTVRPHEHTFAAPRQDRQRFLAESGLQCGALFMLYDDPTRVVEPLIAAAAGGPPLLEVEAEPNETHRVWRLDEPGAVSRIIRQLAGCPLYIADGHHRYEASIGLLHGLRRTGEPTGGLLGAEGRLATLFNLAQGTLRLRPTHRAVHAAGELPDAAALRAALVDEFEVVPLDVTSPVEALARLTRTPAGPAAFVLLQPDGAHRVVARDAEASRARVPGGGSPLWKGLDVNILAHRILGPRLGLDPAAPGTRRRVAYLGDPEAAAQGVAEGRYACAFLVRPTPIEAVKQLADEGQRMPQKSTDFYPKPLSGLVMHRIR